MTKKGSTCHQKRGTLSTKNVTLPMGGFITPFPETSNKKKGEKPSNIRKKIPFFTDEQTQMIIDDPLY